MFQVLPNSIVIVVRQDGVCVDETAYTTVSGLWVGSAKPFFERSTDYLSFAKAWNPIIAKIVKRRTPGVQLLIRIRLLSHGMEKQSFYVTYDLVDEVFAIIP